MVKIYKHLSFTAILMIIFTTITYNIPVLYDDWVWGSEVGLSRLYSGFSNYNGRYFGNILVILLTRYSILKTIIMSILIVGLIYFTYSCFGKKNIIFYIISALLIMLLPISIFSQTVSWVSGFCNYIPPIFLLLICISIFNREFDNEIVKYKNYEILLVIILGIGMQLFMETNTIYNVIISLFILLYTYKKYKKIKLMPISFCLSTILGAIIMFCNGAYINIQKHEDSYRSVPTGFKQLILQMYQHFERINKELFMQSLLLNSILAIGILLIIKINKKQDKYNLYDYIFTIIVSAYPIYLFLGIYRVEYNNLYEKYMYIFESIFTIAFYISVIISIIKYISNCTNKLKMLIIILSIVVLTAPLLVVNPLSPRCYLNTYVFIIMLIIELFSYITTQLKVDFKMLNIIGLASVFILGVIYINIFNDIGKAEKSRQSIVSEQLELNKKEIIVPKLPHSKYLMLPNRMKADWEKYAIRKYYDVSEEILFNMYDLKEEKNINKYLENIDRNNYTVIISYKYDKGKNNKIEDYNINDVDISNLLKNNYGNSFIKIMNSGEVLFCEDSKEEITFSNKIDGVNIKTLSKGLDNGNELSIKINNIEFAINKPGVNIVVYDNIQDKVIDSVSFKIDQGTTVNR